MGKPFTEAEKKTIYNNLLIAGNESLIKYGYKGTSIDDIAKKVGISKGGFYNFFESKELFLFQVMEEIQNEIKLKVDEIVPKDKENFKEQLAINLNNFMKIIREPKYISVFNDEQMKYVFSGMSDDAKREYYFEDGKEFISLFKDVKELIDYQNIQTDFVSGVIRSIIILLTHEKEIGKMVLNKVVEVQIKLLVDYMCK